MSDVPAESGSGVTEKAAPPVPAFASSTSATAPASRPASDDTLFERLLEHPKFAEQVERAVHRTKDRRFQALGAASSPEGIAALESFIKAAGGDVQKGVRDYRVDQLLQQAEQEPAPAAPAAPVQGRTTAPEANDDVTNWTTDILTEAGVDWNTDEAYKALAAKPYATPDAWKAATVKFIAQRAKQGFQPGAATNQSVGPAAPPTPKGSKQERKDAIYARLDETQKEPTRFAGERAKLKAELKALD